MKPDMPDTRKARSQDTDIDTETTCLVLMRVSRASPHETHTGTQIPTTNTVRATTITVVLEKILTHSGYVHGGINE